MLKKIIARGFTLCSVLLGLSFSSYASASSFKAPALKPNFSPSLVRPIILSVLALSSKAIASTVEGDLESNTNSSEFFLIGLVQEVNTNSIEFFTEEFGQLKPGQDFVQITEEFGQLKPGQDFVQVGSDLNSTTSLNEFQLSEKELDRKRELFKEYFKIFKFADADFKSWDTKIENFRNQTTPKLFPYWAYPIPYVENHPFTFSTQFTTFYPIFMFYDLDQIYDILRSFISEIRELDIPIQRRINPILRGIYLVADHIKSFIRQITWGSKGKLLFQKKDLIVTHIERHFDVWRFSNIDEIDATMHRIGQTIKTSRTFIHQILEDIQRILDSKRNMGMGLNHNRWVYLEESNKWVNYLEESNKWFNYLQESMSYFLDQSEALKAYIELQDQILKSRDSHLEFLNRLLTDLAQEASSLNLKIRGYTNKSPVEDSLLKKYFVKLLKYILEEDGGLKLKLREVYAKVLGSELLMHHCWISTYTFLSFLDFIEKQYLRLKFNKEELKVEELKNIVSKQEFDYAFLIRYLNQNKEKYLNVSSDPSFSLHTLAKKYKNLYETVFRRLEKYILKK